MTDADPASLWRALSGWPGAAAANWAAAGDAAASTGLPPHDWIERFGRAARTYLAASATPDAAAAHTFSEALRDLFSFLLPPLPLWETAVGGAGTPASRPLLPAVGLSREHQLRWQRLIAAAGQFEEAQRRLQRLWLDALRDAGADFRAALARPPPVPGDAATDSPAANPPPADDPATSIRRLYDLWIDCAEAAYSRAAHGPAFCDALADAVNTGSRWRHELKALVEESSKFLDLPTRSELNTLQERLRAVEAELREARARPRRPRKT